MRNILDLSSTEARDFLLKKESYASIDLPTYIDFSPVIAATSDEICDRRFADIIKSNGSRKLPSDCDDVNYVLFNNKDGQFAWRPFSLINPVLYVLFVNDITTDENWNLLKTRFAEFQSNPKIKSLGLPVVSGSRHSDTAEQVTSWWLEVEQESIALALEFDYVAHTDISECYSSIYSHSIAWAIHGKTEAKKQRRQDSLLGNRIDKYLQAMSNGQTNGIPQGSRLMDFVSEMLLGYADLRLSKKIEVADIGDFRILRYRDDYRIFVNNSRDAEIILKLITETLIEFGHHLNPHKTFISDNIVRDSVKPDKLHWISNFRESRNQREKLQIIHSFAAKFPNSGTVRKLLSDYNTSINRSWPGGSINLFVIASIAIDIGFKSPSAVPYCAAILSRVIFALKEDSDKERVLSGITRKFNLVPNTGLLQIWIQRILLKSQLNCDLTETLCKKVTDSSVTIWNTEWLDEKLRSILKETSILNEKALASLTGIISPVEVNLYALQANYY